MLVTGLAPIVQTLAELVHFQGSSGCAAEIANRVTPASTNTLPLPPLRPTCKVTVPNGAQRPGRPAAADGYANDVLWTLLWPEGRVVFEPGGAGFVLPDGSLGMKWPWVPLVPGELSITGERLDGPALPLRAMISSATDQYGEFFPSYLIFSTPGCWEVTGHIGRERLTFVTSVVQVGDGPDWRPGGIPSLSE